MQSCICRRLRKQQAQDLGKGHPDDPEGDPAAAEGQPGNSYEFSSVVRIRGESC